MSNSYSNSYNLAVRAIREVAEATQARLDKVEAEARERYIKSLRDAFLEGVSQDDPACRVCCLLAQTVEFQKREGDGYPLTIIPETTKSVILAAVAAGVINLTNNRQIKVGGISFYNDMSGIVHYTEEHNAYLQAWFAASDFRKAQTWTKL
jgi:hypothetical protein